MLRPGSTDELSDLWAQAREYERRTFSNVAVTDPATGIKNLEVGNSRTTIRDSLGNILFQTSPTWGLAYPRNGYPAYPAWPAVAGRSTTFSEIFLFLGYVYGQSLEYGYIHGTEFPDTTSECRLEYTTDFVSFTPVPGSTTQSNQDVSDTTTVFTLRSGTFTLPVVTSGQAWGVRLVCRYLPGGSGITAWGVPVYLNQL